MLELSIQPMGAKKISFEAILKNIQKAAARFWGDEETGMREQRWYENLLGIGGKAPLGFIASEGNNVMGFIVYGVEDNLGILQGLYVHTTADRKNVAKVLLASAFDALRRSHKVSRIKNRFYTWPEDYISRPFNELGFRVVDRANMALDLAQRHRIPNPPLLWRISPDLGTVRWKADFQWQFEVLLHESSQDDEDPVFTPDELTREGTEKRVAALLADELHPYSRVILSGDKMLGAIIVCVYGKDVDKRVVIQELCVDPGFRSKGLGSTLLEGVLNDMERNGEKDALLTVTLQNKEAYNLYAKFGFVVQRIIPYAIWVDESAPDTSGD